MVRVARARISDLFSLAEREAMGGHPELADRYVVLARRIGMRYNVRLPVEYRELYCRGCSAFWIEGRTVRTRIRENRRVRTCLRCGRKRRTGIRRPARASGGGPWTTANPAQREEGALAVFLPEEGGETTEEESEEE